MSLSRRSATGVVTAAAAAAAAAADRIKWTRGDQRIVMGDSFDPSGISIWVVVMGCGGRVGAA